MAITQLHQLNQALFDSRGVCYWACEYLSTRDAGAWYNWNSKDYAALRTAATQFRQYTPCFNWARNKRDNPQVTIANYNANANPLPNRRFFRVAMYFGASPMPSSGQNHEIMCVTGTGTSVLLFDPNSGFFEIDATGTTANTNKEALEHYVKQDYGNDCRETAREFVYRNVGATQ